MLSKSLKTRMDDLGQDEVNKLSEELDALNREGSSHHDPSH